MTKVCPLMSRPANYPESDFGICECLVDLCMAWEPERNVDFGIERGPDGEPVFLKKTYPGYCRLIERVTA